MICIAIDFAKDKRACHHQLGRQSPCRCVHHPKHHGGFPSLLQRIRYGSTPQDKIKVGFEAARDSRLHMASVYEMLDEFPAAHQIAGTHLMWLKHFRSMLQRGSVGGMSLSVCYRQYTKRPVKDWVGHFPSIVL